MNKLILFTLKDCSHCIELKETLREKNIPFVDIDAEKNAEIWSNVVSLSGYNSLPTVFISINEENDGLLFVPERDYNSKDECVELIIKHL